MLLMLHFLHHIKSRNPCFEEMSRNNIQIQKSMIIVIYIISMQHDRTIRDLAKRQKVKKFDIIYRKYEIYL